MTNGQIEVITSVQRRRRWTASEKERLVAASLEPGVVASEIARAAGIHPSQLFGWRRQLCQRREDAPAFAAVRLAAGPAPAAAAVAMPSGMIEIEFAAGVRIRITGAVDPATLSATVVAVTTRTRRR
jgi:transposase